MSVEMRRTMAEAEAEASEDRPPPFLRPAPFSSRQEREDLERELLQQQPSPTTITAAAPLAAPRDGFVPTAVSVAVTAASRDADSAFDAFDNSAVAVAVADEAERPPPPPVTRSEACQGAVGDDDSRGNKPGGSENFEFDDGVVVRPEPPSYNPDRHDLVPLAHAIPTHESHAASAQQMTASAALRTANAMGGLAAMEETADVARARREQESIQRRVGEDVQWANAKAARQAHKSDEGLAVDEGIHRLEPKSDEAKEDQQKGDDDIRPFGTVGKDGTRGYEVKEYEVAKYETADYETTEYKSVYD